jgi:hypothetical protein
LPNEGIFKESLAGTTAYPETKRNIKKREEKIDLGIFFSFLFFITDRSTRFINCKSNISF